MHIARTFPHGQQAGARAECLVGEIVQEGAQEVRIPGGCQPGLEVLADLVVKLRHARAAQHPDAQQLPGSMPGAHLCVGTRPWPLPAPCFSEQRARCSLLSVLRCAKTMACMLMSD